jgi:GTPase SAR1 family protein
VNVELWDVSGDRRFDAGWAAIQKDAAGVIIVFDGDNGDSERSVPLWYECPPWAARTSCRTHVNAWLLSVVGTVGS